MIYPINIFNKKRYKRMQYCGHNLKFKNWMISIDSGKALISELGEVACAFGMVIASPFIFIWKLLEFIYEIIPKIFINNGKED